MDHDYILIAYTGIEDKKIIWYSGTFEGAMQCALNAYHLEGALNVYLAEISGTVDYSGRFIPF